MASTSPVTSSPSTGNMSNSFDSRSSTPTLVNSVPLTDLFEDNAPSLFGRGSQGFRGKLNQINFEDRFPNYEASARFIRIKSKEVDSGIQDFETPSLFDPEFLYDLPDPNFDYHVPVSVVSPSNANLITNVDDPNNDNIHVNHLGVMVPTPNYAVGFNPYHMKYLKSLFNWSQQQFTANACVFVGNLPSSFTDYQLTLMTQDLYSFYGPCYVHVIRNRTGIPVRPCAHVQYQSADAAATAVAGNGIQMMHGRPLRTSPSTAPRHVTLCPRYPTQPNFHLLHQVFEEIGPVESVRQLDPYGRVKVTFSHHGTYLVARLMATHFHLPLYIMY